MSSPVDAAAHILNLLSRLHCISLEQEAAISRTDKGKVFSSDVLGDLEDKAQEQNPRDAFDQLMLDKFIALDEDKCQFVYQLINAMGATNVVEAGTSFGVSTIYLALAVAKTKAATGKEGVVIATEKEKEKAEIARKYWAECGAVVTDQIDLREGNLLETLAQGLPQVDLLLLDSKSAPYSIFGIFISARGELTSGFVYSLVCTLSSNSQDSPALPSLWCCCSHRQYDFRCQGVCRLAGVHAKPGEWVPEHDFTF